MKTATKTYTPIVMDDDGFAKIEGFDDLPAVRPAKSDAGTELATIPTNLAEAFAPGGLTMFIEVVTEKAKAFEPDISSASGQRALKSMAHKIARSKTYADDAGKQYVADMKAQCKVVDAERKRMCDALDDLKAEVLEPLTKWEAIDKARKDAHEAAIAELIAIGDERRAGATSGQLATLIDSLQTFRERDWQEFDLRASKVIGNVEFYLKEARAAALVSEAEKAELAKFRLAEVERKRQEYEARIAQEAAQRATQEAEERALAERRIVEARERRAVEDAQREQHAAEARAVAAEAAKKAADKRAKDLAAKNEQDRKDAAAKAKRDAEAAVETERLRVAKEAKAKADADAKRAADLQHKGTVDARAAEELQLLTKISLADARDVIAVISAGKIPGVTITY
jgi:colicin import membrane protein